MTTNKMKALRVIDQAGTVGCHIESLPTPEPGPGDILIKTEYSSVNYKDALAATGAGKIMKTLPMTAGIDVAGTVAASQDARFPVGLPVLVTGYGLGVEIDGGYAEYVRVPADWVVPLPDGLTALQAMALGTAGFTAALAVARMQDNGLRPEAGPVAITGATGGVGSLALAMLAQQGYETVAITGKTSQTDYLSRLGAARVLDRRSLEMGTRPLEKSLWAGAVDSVGGATLAWLTRTMAYRGVIAACGLAGGIELSTTVMPFILRGVSLVGIDSVQCPMAQRLEIWALLAGELRPRMLESDIARIIDFDALPGAFQGFLDAGVSGRTVVRLP